jgi:hypothetical protein
LSRTTLWQRRPNLVHWWWAEQNSLKFQEQWFFFKSFRGHKLSKNKMQWLDLVLRLWQALIGLPFASIVQMHFQTIIKFSKPHLSSHSPHYFWFMQYMKNDKEDCRSFQIPLSMVYL